MKIAIMLFILLLIGFGCMLWNNAPAPHFSYEVSQPASIEPIAVTKPVNVVNVDEVVIYAVTPQQKKETTNRVFVCNDFRKTKLMNSFVKECEWIEE